MPRHNQHTVVLYDIPHDRVRARISDACLNFGLVRFQYSAFEGSLTRNRREELALMLAGLMADVGGRIRIVPLCREDVASSINVEIDPPAGGDSNAQPQLSVFTGEDSP